MIVKICILLLLIGFQSSTSQSPEYVQFDEEQLMRTLNWFRYNASTGNFTAIVHDKVNEILDKINAIPYNDSRFFNKYEKEDTKTNRSELQRRNKELLVIRYEKGLNLTVGPMANMKKMSWSEELVNMTMEEVPSCPMGGGVEWSQEPEEKNEAALTFKNITYRLVSIPLPDSLRNGADLNKELTAYFEKNIPLMNMVKPPPPEAQHKNYILGELFHPTRLAIGCTLQRGCEEGTLLVCLMAPGGFDDPPYKEGEPVSQCDPNYVRSNSTDEPDLCIIDPRLSAAQQKQVYDASMRGEKVPLLVPVPQDPDSARSLVGMIFFAFLIARNLL